MKLILTSSIKESELQSVEELFGLDVVKIAAKKCIQGLGKTIKSSAKIPGTQLKKIPITSSAGGGRVVFLLKTKDRKSVLVMIRHKQDKQVGANMTIQNSKFKKVLEKNLDVILKDLQKGNYEEFEL